MSSDAPSPHAGATSPVIRVRHLSKHYWRFARPLDRLVQALRGEGRPRGERFEALADVSFEVDPGEVVGIVGRNGAGKSTLLQMICGTLQPSAGQIDVRGRVAALLELGAGFNPDFTGRENVFLNAALLGASDAEARERFEAIVDFSGLREFVDQPVRTYSSGMYVRLAFSVATAFDPDILVIDEALSVGDGAFARKSFDRIMALKERGATILFCSHSLYHVDALCDRALWLEAGRMRMLGRSQEVTREYQAALDAEAGGRGAATSAPPPAPAPAGGQARLLAVNVDGGAAALRLRSGIDDLTIDVRFQADVALPLPAVGVVLETARHQTVFSTSSALDGVALARDAAGCGQVRLRLPALPLMTGSYLLSVFLTCERSLHVYDHATHCLRFEVSHPGPQQGLVFLPRCWNGAAAPLAPDGGREAGGA